MAARNERLKLEIELIEKYHFMKIKQLAQELNTSEMSIRRDLSKLEKMNMVKLVYGGVITSKLLNANNTKYSFETEQNKNTDQKKRIVKRAIEFLEPNDIVFLDSGTTIQMFAEQIPKDIPFTFITASYNTLERIIDLPESTVIACGGVFSKRSLVFYEPESSNFIRKYRASKSFIGATGYELELGLTCGFLEDVPIKQAMIQSSKYRILLMDSTKFGKVSTCVFAKITDFSTVITDDGINPEYAEHIRSNNVNLIIV